MKKTHKSRHNKKRNTAFLYEVLIQDITRSVMGGQDKRKEVALSICKEFFNKRSVLYEEKELYVSLLEAKGMDFKLIEKLLHEAKKEYSALNKKEIFNTQTKMINRVNKRLSSEVFNNFVSNYKDLATISQILNQNLPLKQRILLENNFLENSSVIAENVRSDLEPTDNLVYKTFVKKYNKKYEEHLLEEQKEVVTRYATSFSDNGISLKIYLNEELGRLKGILKKSLDDKVITEDENMARKTAEVVSILESYRDKKEFTQDSISQILEIQDLVKEIES